MNKSSTPVDVETLVIFVLGALELPIEAAVVPISAVNFFLIAHTSVIHRNLKCILLYQSGLIFVRGNCRIITCTLKFVLLDPVGAESIPPMQTLFSFCVINRNFLAHVLIVERVLATLLFRTYESTKGWHFTAVWMPLVFGATLYNVLTTSTQSMFNLLLTNYALLAVALVEVALFGWLWGYNSRVYRRNANAERMYTLSERYQLSENIRIGSQLIPALGFHFANIAFNNLATNWFFFGAPGPSYMQFSVITITSFCSLMIEITMIIYHPFLKRDFFILLKCNIFRSNRVRNAENGGTGEAIALRDINGNVFPDGQQDHFELLKNQWNETHARGVSRK